MQRCVELSRPTQPCGYPMTQPFMQDILKHAGQHRHGNHGNLIVLLRAFTVKHSVSYNILASGRIRQILRTLFSPKAHPGARIPLRISETESSVTMYRSRFHRGGQPCLTEFAKCGINV